MRLKLYHLLYCRKHGVYISFMVRLPGRVCPCAAEAIYGEQSEQTELLREYRDNVLSKTPDGQEIIKTYYQYSPTVTELLERRPLLKDKARMIIDNMLPGIRKKVQESSK